MELKGKVVDGVIVPDRRVELPEGAEIRFNVVKQAAKLKKPKKKSALSKVLLKYAGSVKGLPKDAARNHDHYLYGTPKK